MMNPNPPVGGGLINRFEGLLNVVERGVVLGNITIEPYPMVAGIERLTSV
jgi:hypothetical protein